jgi:hypothetical protein
VSTTQAELVAKFALPPVSLKPAANLPLMSLTSVVHLDLRISPQIFEKMVLMDLGLGETDS